MDFLDVLFPADKINTQAFETNCKASKMKAEALAEVEKTNATFQAAVVKLRDRKLGIINTSFADFIDVYDKISRIEFKQSDGISELMTLNLPPEIYENHRGVSCAPAFQLTSGQEVKAFLKGALFGGFFGGMREWDKQEAQQALATAQANKKAANVVVSQCDLEVTALRELTEKLNRMSALLTKLNMLFRTAIAKSNEVISETGYNRNCYSDDKLEMFRCTISLAQTIKTIIDQPILNKKDEVSAEAMNVLVSGEKVYEQMQNAISKI